MIRNIGSRMGFGNLVLVILFGVLAAGYGLWLGMRQVRPSPADKPAAPASDGGDAMITYFGEDFEFQYPAALSMARLNDAVLLTHDIAYTHPDPCDLRGGSAPLDRLTDFHSLFRVVYAGLKDTVRQNESDYVMREFFQGETPDTSRESLFEPFSVGALRGYRLAAGAEGCGQTSYYIPLSSNRTLVVLRPYVAEFSGASGNREKYLALPGVISPTEADNIFGRILSSFVLVAETPAAPAGETMPVKLYFLNTRLRPINSCEETVAVTRNVPKTPRIGTAALAELLKGPTAAEKAQGYATELPAEGRLNSLVVIEGEAQADFNTATESGGGSCSMIARTAQIRDTLLQFPTVVQVRISVDSRTEDIFQP